jgi:hypothetical protein
MKGKITFPVSLLSLLIRAVLKHNEFSQEEKLKTIDFLIGVSSQDVESGKDEEDDGGDNDSEITVPWKIYFQIAKIFAKVFDIDLLDLD